MNKTHRVIEPKILYFAGVLISTTNEDGSPNLAPMSSAWWLGRSCMLGLGTRAKTFENLRRTRECVLNLPSSDLVAHVDRLALTTGKYPVPEYKTEMGFEHVADKFGRANLTATASEIVTPPRVAECPVQLEAVIENFYMLGLHGDYTSAIDARVVRVYIAEQLLDTKKSHYIDTDKMAALDYEFLRVLPAWRKGSSFEARKGFLAE